MAGVGRAAITWRLMFARAEDKLAQYDNMESSHRVVDGRGPLGASIPMCGGAAKRISKGLRLFRVRFRILMYISTIGRAFVQGSFVSAQHFASLFLIVPFSLSTAPPLAGWYAQCFLMSMPKYAPNCVIASFVKCVPLSLEILLGIPQRGIISLSNAFATAPAVCEDVGKASTHLDHMSTITRQCFFPSEGVSSMKSIIMCSKGLDGGG